MKAVLRIFSYLFHGVLALFLLAISGLTLSSGTHNLYLDVLPWKGSSLTYWLFFSSLIGLVAVVLAITGKLRVLFLLWTVAVSFMLVKGFFLSGYQFETPAAVKPALYLTLASLVAISGGWFQFRRKPAAKESKAAAAARR